MLVAELAASRFLRERFGVRGGCFFLTQQTAELPPDGDRARKRTGYMLLHVLVVAKTRAHDHTGEMAGFGPSFEMTGYISVEPNTCA